jgi:hypothetical protein
MGQACRWTRPRFASLAPGIMAAGVAEQLALGGMTDADDDHPVADVSPAHPNM